MADTQELPTGPTPQEQQNEPWRLLGTLPSTNAKVVVGQAIVVATALFYFAAAWTGRDARMQPSMWDTWLFFLATGVLGVSAAQYVAKRITYRPGAPDAQRAAASTPGPEAEAERQRAAAVEQTRATAEQPAAAAPPAASPAADPAATLDAMQAEFRRQAAARFGPNGERGDSAPPAPSGQPAGQGD